MKIANEMALETVDVDLNFSLDWTSNYNQKMIDEILNNRVKIELDETNVIYSANVYDNIIQLCAHLYKDTALIDIVKKSFRFIQIY